MNKPFDDFDLSDFWEESDYASDNYVSEELTDALVSSIERQLGYRLPASYIALMKHQNGGIPARTNHRTSEPTSWADDHVAITGLYGIAREKPNSLCGERGSRFWMEEWEYPPIGVYFADCPSAGHDMLCLDYQACGADGEPRVVHVDQESDFAVTHVADTFEDFIRGLEPDDAFEDDAKCDAADIKSAWIDPEFAKQFGIDAPEDGWLKGGPDDADKDEEEE